MQTTTEQPSVVDVREITACRLCESAHLWPFFLLGQQPLANDLVPPGELDRIDFRAPLTVVRCDTCGHVQLLHTVSPTRLFSDYRFQSGIASGWHQHCADFAAEQTERRGPGFVVDIGSNDGTLLTKFQALGWHVVGIEPAANLARTALVQTFHGSLTTALAQWVRSSYRPADLVVAQNVLGHVDDPIEFLRAARALLAPDGELVIEVPDLRRLLNTLAFDTIYHEHLSYWSDATLRRAASRAGLRIVESAFLLVHGGSLRVTLRHEQRLREPWTFADDDPLGTREPFHTFQARVEEHLQELRNLWSIATPPIWGYGASAKATVLLNALGLVPERIVDDTPGKQGFYIPGVRVPITAPVGLETAQTLVLLSWNWADELKQRARALGFGGEFLMPWPEPVLT